MKEVVATTLLELLRHANLQSNHNHQHTDIQPANPGPPGNKRPLKRTEIQASIGRTWKFTVTGLTAALSYH